MLVNCTESCCPFVYFDSTAGISEIIPEAVGTYYQNGTSTEDGTPIYKNSEQDLYLYFIHDPAHRYDGWLISN